MQLVWKGNSLKALDINLIDNLVDTIENLMKQAFKKAKFLFTINQTVFNVIKLCGNHIIDKTDSEASKIEKKGSAWYEHEDKNSFIKEYRKLFKLI